MRATPLVLTLITLISFAPAAVGDDVCAPLGLPATVCVVDHATADGDCASGGFQAGTTKVDVEAPGTASAEAGGAWFCSGTYEQNSVFVEAYTGFEGASASWTEFSYEDPENGAFRQCFVSAGAVFQTCPDGVSPPNPGWGALLP